MTSGRWLICLCLGLVSSGCSLHKLTHAFTPDCHAPQEYQRAVQVAPLRVPAGLDAPNVQSALVIPAVDVAPPPAGDKEPCLDSPPRFKVTAAVRPAAEPPLAAPAPATPATPAAPATPAVPPGPPPATDSPPPGPVPQKD
jgi:hypothetical protein